MEQQQQEVPLHPCALGIPARVWMAGGTRVGSRLRPYGLAVLPSMVVLQHGMRPEEQRPPSGPAPLLGGVLAGLGQPPWLLRPSQRCHLLLLLPQVPQYRLYCRRPSC